MGRLHRTINRRQWAIARRAALERAGYQCAKCGRHGRMEVDHVRPLQRGGDPLAAGNLQVLCRHCHHAKTGAENGRPIAGRAAWLVELKRAFG